MNGTLLAEGTGDSRIDFDGAGSANIVSGKGASAAVLRLRYADVHDGGALWPPTGYSQNAQWLVADSTFRNLSQYSYLWYPSADSVFERNVFTDSAGFSVGTDTRSHPGQVRFENNRFVTASRSGYWIRNWAAYGQPTVVTGNTFMVAGSPTLELQDGYNSAAISAPSNYWSTTDTAVIDSMIADSHDSISRAGVISYDPPLTGSTPETPPTQAAPASPTPTPASASPTPAHQVPSLTVNPYLVKFGQTAYVTIHGTPGATIDLYVRKYLGGFTEIRHGQVLDGTGSTVLATRPDMNLRFQAIDRTVAEGSSMAGTNGLMTVEKNITINVRRDGSRRYTFSGSLNPTHPGATVSLFRNGTLLKSGIPVSSSRVCSFTTTLAAGTYNFQIRSGSTGYNAASASAVKSARVY